uniref:G-protein coupled receptors family 3 profile domain-containing protein n=1 Tax=Acrobeloides nanus TaxID=290746 RepID=A0A914D3L9_9BILA
MVGRQALVAAALRKLSTHAYGTLSARRPCLLNQPIAACRFYIVIFSLFVLDFIIIFFWVIIDPLRRQEQRFHLHEPQAGTDEDVMLLPILELCQSTHQEVWIAIVLGYKCLLLVFGLFLAYESRNLKLRYINDSRFVSMAIYNVAILSLVTGPVVTLLIRTEANANFAFVSVTVLLCTYISLGLVFVPKILHVYRVPHDSDEIQTSGTNLRATISRPDQLRYEQLIKEQTELKKQIDMRDGKINECRKILERRLGTQVIVTPQETSSGPSSGATQEVPTNNVNNNVSSSFVSDDQPTQSTMFTTALIEHHGGETGPCSDFDTTSNSSDEILL